MKKAFKVSGIETMKEEILEKLRPVLEDQELLEKKIKMLSEKVNEMYLLKADKVEYLDYLQNQYENSEFYKSKRRFKHE